MERSCLVVLGLLLLLALLDLSLVNSEVGVSSKAGSDSNSNSTVSSSEKLHESGSVTNSTGTENAGKGGVGLNLSKEVKKNGMSKIGNNETDNLQKGKGDLSEAVEIVQRDEKVRKSDDDTESKKASREKGNDADSIPLIVTKESSHSEICDPLNSCTDEEDQFVACLRVPGNESPDLSLLIQNQGRHAIVVTIIASSFVQLEKNKVQLQTNEDKKVKVSIRHGGRNSSIILTGEKGRCSLDFRDLITHSFGKDQSHNSSQSTHLKSLLPPSVVLVFAAIVVLIPISICFRWRQRQSKKYQRIDMDLPVTKTHTASDDGWNSNWGDDSWDDEEAPKTPSLPVTPSVSSRGLASRRLSKEAWKD